MAPITRIANLLLAAFIPALLGAGAATDSGPAPSFNRDIAPILYRNCSSCHRPGQVAPFALLTYKDAVKHAKQIATVTQSRYMPPWKAEPGFGQFKDERRLTDEEIATLRNWANNGAPEGDADNKRIPPKFVDGWQAGPPDRVVSMTDPVSLPAGGPDQFRCFVIPLGNESAQWVNKVEFHPGNRKVVHHAIIFLDATGEARRREKVPGQGYDCVGGPGLAISGGLGGWAPGATPTVLSEGLAITVAKSSDLVVQMHYHLSGKPETDQSSIGLSFTQDAPKKGMALVMAGNRRIDIAPGDDHFVVKASAELPMDAETLSIFPHAHYLCKDMKVDAHLPDGSVKPMIWIKDWDFNWQGAYRYETPLKLPKGTRIEMEYTFDNSANNSRNPSNPPTRVKFGEQTTNEMAFTFISVSLDDPADVPEFQRDMSAHFIADMIDGGSDDSGLDPKRVAQMKATFNFFDKNKNGKLDPEEKQALIEFLKKQNVRL